MHTSKTFLLVTALASALVAQTAETTASSPGIKWRGALWTSAAASDRQTQDGSLFLRSMDAGDGSMALDGLQVGADITLVQGWAAKFTILAGQDAKVLNAATGEMGSFAYPEAMLVWTGGAETVRIGRMYTCMGMEVMDQTQNIAASRGLLFTYALPFAQLGVHWRHAFTKTWSGDVFLFNGEDRLQDNNRGKTAGLGLNYNHGGASDKFLSLMVYRGPEQDGLGAQAGTGAEGRLRERISHVGQWVWGGSTLQWEAEWAREAFRADAIVGATDNVQASWHAVGATFKRQFNDRWAAFVRAEVLWDDTGVRLSGDPTVAALYAPTGYKGTLGADLQAQSLTLGAERKWGSTFLRLEVRRDHLNKEVQEGTTGHLTGFQSAYSATCSLGTSF